MHSSAVFQVAHHGDGEVVKAALCLIDRVEIEHCLAWMLVGTVASVDDWHGSEFAGISCGALNVVAHHNKVGIVAYHHDGVFEGFALATACGVGIGETYHSTSKSIYRSLEAETCACGWFEEKGGNHFTFKDFAVGVFFEVACFLNQF